MEPWQCDSINLVMAEVLQADEDRRFVYYLLDHLSFRAVLARVHTPGLCTDVGDQFQPDGDVAGGACQRRCASPPSPSETALLLKTIGRDINNIGNYSGIVWKEASLLTKRLLDVIASPSIPQDLRLREAISCLQHVSNGGDCFVTSFLAMTG